MNNKIKMECGKCNGKGQLSEYKHIKGGKCFACKGKGYYMTTQNAIDQKQQNETKRNDKAAIMKEWSYTKMDAFLKEFSQDQEFINIMDGRDPNGNGFQLAFNTMQVYEARGKFKYDVPKPA